MGGAGPIGQYLLETRRQVAVVTSATTGIGLAAAKAFAASSNSRARMPRSSKACSTT